MSRRPTVGLLLRCLDVLGRPFVEVVDMIADVAAMLAKAWSAAGRAHLFERPARQADIVGGLVGVQKWAALLRIRGSDDLVIHHRRSPFAVQASKANVAAPPAQLGAVDRKHVAEGKSGS